jgi:ribosomal protein S18 acetylase RimI-like enzyme
MASGVTFEILDLRHFAAPEIRPVLEAEGELWRQRLHWDHRPAAKLLMQYLDTRSLPGYAAIEAGHVTGYSFCVYEDTKAVIGDVFAISTNPLSAHHPNYSFLTDAAHEIETTLLRHILELLLNSPQTQRIESQLLLHPAGTHEPSFREAGFQIFRRLYLVKQLTGPAAARPEPRLNLPGDLELRPWRDEDLNPAGRLIAEAYRHHPDSHINDQYRSVHGSVRFLHNIVRFSGCGLFSAPVSHVVIERTSREPVALILGSRISPQCGHITQLCVHPNYRRRGLARLLLSVAGSFFLRQGVTEISLTVTEANADAIELYNAEGYNCTHAFDAAVWRRDGIN